MRKALRHHHIIHFTKGEKNHRTALRLGFTIVELLVVVVVIAVLAAIVVVAYNGVTGQAKEVALKSDLRNAASSLEHYMLREKRYPANADELKKSDGTILSYSRQGVGSYCLEARNQSLPDRVFHVREDGRIADGVCPPPSTMQAMTPGYCSSMPIYTGSNPQAILSLTDKRGDTTRTYRVAKLSDGNCWMLDNLKLGSTSGSVALSSSDSDVSSSFILPQLSTSGATEFDLPRAYGPIPGDTGSGATNYGYLYNWSAATAGESRATMPNGSGNAANSICPAGWRLPLGTKNGTWSDPQNEFIKLDVSFGGTGNYASNGPSLMSWVTSGPFGGVSSGIWDITFKDQGAYGRLWSSSSDGGSQHMSSHMSIAGDFVYPNPLGELRHNGFAIRCLVKQ